jgi:pimeloyl-ACP methyl ester carboxylesterase
MWIVENIWWVLVISGLLTCSMITMMLAPRFAMLSTFGEIAEGPVANLIARSWGAMIFASGLMLIFAADHPETRLPILLYSIVGKLGFIGLVLAEPRIRRPSALVAVGGDLVIVTLLGWYLLVR